MLHNFCLELPLTLFRILSWWNNERPPQSVVRVLLRDALQRTTLGKRHGGQVVAGGGWQTTSKADFLVYDLDC